MRGEINGIVPYIRGFLQLFDHLNANIIFVRLILSDTPSATSGVLNHLQGQCWL